LESEYSQTCDQDYRDLLLRGGVILLQIAFFAIERFFDAICLAYVQKSYLKPG